MSNLCIVCNARPKYVDGTKTHPYCGKFCAGQAANQAANLVVVTPAVAICTQCGVRPRYADGRRTHNYCGRSCVLAARAGKPAAATSAPSTPAKTDDTAATATTTTSGAAATSTSATVVPVVSCKTPGCQQPVYATADGTTSEYCSRTHASQAKVDKTAVCLHCHAVPRSGDFHFCGKTCARAAQAAAPALLEVPTDHEVFNGIADQFRVSWRHTHKTIPKVARIYKVMATKASLDQYAKYRDGVEARGNFASISGFTEGNERRRWHGTKRECLTGDPGNKTLCSSSSCSLCCIVRTSFDINCFGNFTGWGRFGRGVYTSSTSSKSDDYSRNALKSSYKVVLLNKVVVGRGCKLTKDNSGLNTAPAGYDSVLGEKGSALNHDELIVYTNEAIRPSWVVVYEAK